MRCHKGSDFFVRFSYKLLKICKIMQKILAIKKICLHLHIKSNAPGRFPET